MAFLLFCILFSSLFFLSRSSTRILSHLFQKVFKNQTTTIHALSFLFLPGVILHELSHLIIANVLFVQTGEVEFFPEIRGSEVKMGSVAIAKTDPFRRFLIGVAPIIGGISVMLLAVSYLLSSSLFSWQNLVLFYCIFEISNTMFSSNKDMEGALGFGIGVLLLGGILQIVGLPLWQYVVQFFETGSVNDVFARSNFFLLIAIGIDIFLVLLFSGISRFHKGH